MAEARTARRDRADHKGLVVGIGASAGGLAAFRRFLTSTPADTGMAFVLIQHLDPHHKSMLVELLAAGSPIPVVQAEDGAAICGNCVHVIPPDATLTISGGVLRLVTPVPNREDRRGIDMFFSSLAEDCGERAVAIVLSGVGSDGTYGVRTIKEHGGLTMAQADFDAHALHGMPQSAAASGMVDHVVPVEAMPRKLIDYQHHLDAVAGRKQGDGVRKDAAEHLAVITGLLRARIDHDFSGYKAATLIRRIQRRMQVLQIEDIAAYIDRLEGDDAEPEALCSEFLIGVTRFFRDRDAFAALGRALPELIAGAADALRVWVPACSTGEEVYSIAILLREALAGRTSPSRYELKIFGTDIDKSAIAAARQGRYRGIAADVSPERLERWFVKDGEDWCPRPEIREICIFSEHSVVKDPPFSRLDLISCRNLLIYLDGDLQKRLAQTFHYALRPGGYLFLGSSESLARSARYFTTVDQKHHLLRRRDIAGAAPLPRPDAAPAASPEAGHAARPAEDRIDKGVRRIMERYAPAYFVIDNQQEIVRFSGSEARHYLEPSPGAANLNLFSMLQRSLRPAVRAAVQRAIDTSQAVVDDTLAIEIEGRSRLLSLIIEPILDSGDKGRTLVVAFRDRSQPPHARPDAPAPSGAADAHELEEELRATKAQLRAMTDQLETYIEDTKASTEEYQAVNEELQSSNEELETAKEEMQSVNEELQTINSELNTKNDLLERLNGDLQNLLDSTQIATVFLDEELRIKHFTPKITALFPLRDSDRGRAITDIVNLLDYATLEADVATVHRTLAVVERELALADGSSSFVMRIRPYRTVRGTVEGVVMTFVDVTAKKQAELHNALLAAIVEQSADALLTVSAAGLIETWNPAAQRLFGYAATEALGQPAGLLAAPAEAAQQEALIARALAGERVVLDAVRRHKDGSPKDVSISVGPLRTADGSISGVSAIVRDIAHRKAHQRQLEFLTREVMHRSKNQLALIQAMVRQTARRSTTVDEYTAGLAARIQALSALQDLLLSSGGQGAPLADLVRAHLHPFEEAGQSKVGLDGPDVTITDEAAHPLGMAFHELATNATKHGALSAPDGTVAVQWSVTGGRLRIVWRESGGPPLERPNHRGFGLVVIEEMLKRMLQAEVTMDFARAGLRCTIELPAEGVIGAA